jgi:fimbrial chaperone protein
MRPEPLPAALICVGSLIFGTAKAADLEISPVAISLAHSQSVTTMEITNRGDAPTAVQVRAYAWAQAGDEDILTPTTEVILSPPIFTIPAGGSQTLRVLLRGGAATVGERTYRLVLDEVPPASVHSQQITTLLRASLPVIVASASPTPARLEWRADRDSAGGLVLSATNMGQAYDAVRAIEVVLADGAHRTAIPRGGNPYVLTGAQRHWIVAGGAAPAGGIRLDLTTRGGRSEQSLALAP